MDINLKDMKNEMFEKLDDNQKESEKIGYKSLSYWQDVWKRYKKNNMAMFGLIIIIVLLLISIFTPFVYKYSYDEQNLNLVNIPPVLETYTDNSGTKYFMNKDNRIYIIGKENNIEALMKITNEDMFEKKMYFSYEDNKVTLDYKSKPFKLLDSENAELKKSKKIWYRQHPLGTDAFGRDMFIRLVYGARISLLVAFIATFVNSIIGTIYGGASGFVGGRTDNIMMRIVDIINTIPLTLFVILIMIVVGPGLKSIIIAIGSVYWVGMARLVRGQVLTIKEQEFVMAARTIGTSSKDILLRHLLPNAMGPIIVSMTMLIPKAIFVEAFLSYIGLGVPVPMASWGTLCNDALDVLKIFPYQLIEPSLAICITMFAFNFLGDGLRDTLDPKLRK